MNLHSVLLAAILVLSVSVTGEVTQPFRVGIAVDEGDVRTDVCDESEMQFMKDSLQKYVVGLARLFFRDQSIELAGDLQEADESQFSPLSFEDFNSYEVLKFAHGTGEVVDKTGTTFPTASLAPSMTPTRSPVMEFLHLEDDNLVVSVGQEAPIDNEIRSANLATSAPVTSAPASIHVTPAPITTAPVTSAPVTSAPVSTAPVDVPVHSPVAMMPISDAPYTTIPDDESAPACVMLDFSTYPDGTPVMEGDYVSDEWEQALGVRVTVEGRYSTTAYTPIKEGTTYKQARIFDTSNPGTHTYDRDPDLGSPNQACPGGGPGVGEAGAPGQPGENCVPLGNGLIIQESNKEATDDAYYGGTFTFEFTEPVDFKSMGLLSVYSNSHMYVYTNDTSTPRSLWPKFIGHNAVQDIEINSQSVTKIVLDMTKTGAVTYLNYCPAGYAATERRLEHPKETHSRKLLRHRIPETDSVENKAVLAPEAERNLQLTGYKFTYGGNQAWICRFCHSSIDSRRLQSGFLISALETVLSFGLTADITFNYKDFLNEQNRTIGCLGGGDGLRVVFELS